MHFFDNISRNSNGFKNCITTIDSHTEGEMTRLIVNGLDKIQGDTMMAKLATFKSDFDHVRCLLTKEPRGSKDTVAALVTKNVTPEAKFGLLYMDAKRYPYLCGHATIGALVTLVETGFLQLENGENPIQVDTPSGLIHSRVIIVDNRIAAVMIDMVPSFVYATEQKINVENFGQIKVDIVCTGGFFAMISADQIQIAPTFENRNVLADLGMKIIQAANAQLSVIHPHRPEVNTIDVAEFYDSDFESGGASGQGIVVYGESHVDRSPCGTGTAAKLTLLHHYGKIAMEQEYINYSPLRTSFGAKLVGEEKIGNQNGYIVQIKGMAYLTGLHHFLITEKDPFKQGFLM